MGTTRSAPCQGAASAPSCGPWGRADLDASSLRVRHSEHVTSHMEALYLSD
ncbi:DUF6333 family protein [Streptomyces sp. Isolate_219]|uniref:DUF6333 family protein n=1 Tax=Streptomyces sp. Isolate_219 TaxID=2950110 RepID=UPI003966FC61